NDSLAPDALLRTGDAYAHLWRRPELDPTYGQTAIAVYQELQSRYPNSLAARRAGGRIEDLDNRFALKAYLNGLHYFKYKARDSAILLFKDLIITYPRTRVIPLAFDKLIATYQELGYVEDIRSTCAYLAKTYPTATVPLRRCPPGSTVVPDSTVAKDTTAVR